MFTEAVSRGRVNVEGTVGRRVATLVALVATASLVGSALSACSRSGIDDASGEALGEPGTAVAAPPTTSVTTTDPPPPARDPFLRPFASDSIWNTPLGRDADLVDAGLEVPKNAGGDPTYIVRTTSADPVRPVYATNHNFEGGRCSRERDTGIRVRVPDSFFLPDATENSTPNNWVTFVDPDGYTLRGFSASARCLHDSAGRQPGDPGYGTPPIDYTFYAEPNEYSDGPEVQDLRGPGLFGPRGATAMSALGGALRPGELLGPDPIGHVLALEVWAERNLHYSPGDGDEHSAEPGQGFRWPANRADSYAEEEYGGSNPRTVMGSLLAVPRSLTPEEAGVTTEAGRKIFAALQTYGAYIVADTYWDSVALAFDQAAMEEYRLSTSNEFGVDETGAELRRMTGLLMVVDDNAPSRIGGAGPRLAPPTPPLTGS